MRIVISGTVGVGKTTTAKNLTSRLQEYFDDVNFILETPEENPYLSLYYKNRPEWSFLIQMDFLLSRYKKLIEEEEKQLLHPKRISIFDRHFLDDKVFANLQSVVNDMSSFQQAEYQKTNEHLSKKIEPERQPDFFILLKTDFNEVLERMGKRARKSELDVDKDYWRDLYYQYYENDNTIKYFKENTKKFILLDINGLNEGEVVDKIITLMNIK